MDVSYANQLTKQMNEMEIPFASKRQQNKTARDHTYNHYVKRSIYLKHTNNLNELKTNISFPPACMHAHTHSHTYLCMYTHMCTYTHTEFKNGFPSTMYL